MKKKLIFVLIVLSFNYVFSQVAIGKSTVDNSAVLEISSLNNRGVLLPRVDIADVLNSAPVSSPAEGLIVFNKGNTISAGLYIWQGNRWNQIGDSFNMVSYLMLQRNTN